MAKKQRTLDEYRQSKDFGYKPKQFTEDVCTGQTDKVKEKITKIIDQAALKLNHGTTQEKMMAVGTIQLLNEIEQLTKLCPNDSSLGKSFRKMFVNEK
jgi:hypothetical protein